MKNTKVALVAAVLALPLTFGCSKKSEEEAASSVNCDDIPKINTCFSEVADSMKACFFYVPSMTGSDTPGTFDAGKAQCTYTNKVITFSPAIGQAGSIGSQTGQNSTVTFATAGASCGTLETTGDADGMTHFKLAKTGGKSYEMNATSDSAYEIKCGDDTITGNAADFMKCSQTVGAGLGVATSGSGSNLLLAIELLTMDAGGQTTTFAEAVCH